MGLVGIAGLTGRKITIGCKKRSIGVFNEVLWTYWARVGGEGLPVGGWGRADFRIGSSGLIFPVAQDTLHPILTIKEGNLIYVRLGLVPVFELS